MPTQPHLPRAFNSTSHVGHLRVESGSGGPGIFVIAVFGEVDIASASVLRDALDGALDNGHRQVIVDINGVTFMDATMLNLLLETSQRAVSMGATMRVRSPTSHDRRLFTLVGLEHLLD